MSVRAAARLSLRHRRAVAAAWLLLAAAGAALAGQLFGGLADVDERTPGAESTLAEERLERLERAGAEIVAVIEGRPATDPGLRQSVLAVTGALRQTPGVAEVDDFYSSPGPWVASDLHASLVRVELAYGLPAAERERLTTRVAAALAGIDAPRVLVGGEDLAEEEFAQLAASDLARGELVALPALLAVLLLAFGGAVPAAVPLAVALATLATSFLALLAASAAAPVSEFSLNVATLVGLGLAVDYSLLIVARFREERARGLEVPAAAEQAMATAGRTAAISGLAVLAAMLGLLAFREPLFHSLALGGMAVTVTALAATATLIPALLGLVGARIRPAPEAASGRFLRAVQLVQRHPGAVAAATTLALAALALPFTRAHLVDPGERALPRDAVTRQVAEALRLRFGTGEADPIVVLADVRSGTAELVNLLNQINRLPATYKVELRPDPPPGVQVIEVTPEGPSTTSPAALQLVRDLRSLDTPVRLAVTGEAAEAVDAQASVAGRLPAALALVVLATFALLFLLTGSVVIPIKALVMNLLSLGASLGALVWVFQEGHLAWLLRFDPAGSVDLTTAVLVLLFTFGLAMDYEVFLLSRIKEAHDGRGRAGREAGGTGPAVALGLARSGPVVTAAAAAMLAVFLGFAVAELLAVKAMGVGMMVAIALDATVVRFLLLPAAMTLLDEWNWWAPAPLRRLHARLVPPPGGPARARHGAEQPAR